MRLNRDMMFYLALDYDLDTVISFCGTSKEMNKLICQNDEFWRQKLIRDFDITYNNDVKNYNYILSWDNLRDYIRLDEPREYYFDISKWIKDYPDVNRLYYHAVAEGRLDIVKIALDRGADINDTSISRDTPLIRTMIYNQPEIFEYLLARGVINSKNSAIKNVNQAMMAYMAAADRNIFLKQYYDELLPATYPYITDKAFWLEAMNSLKQFSDHFWGLKEVYDRRINEFFSRAY